MTDNLKYAFRGFTAGHELVTLATVSDYMLGTRTPPTVQEAERAPRQYIWFFKENGRISRGDGATLTGSWCRESILFQ